MAAEILEQSDLYVDEHREVPELVEEMSPDELAQSFAEPDTTAPPQEDDDDIPDKYKGKSIKEIVSMHAEAEKLIGKQGSEVGELRKVVDTYINGQLAQQFQGQKAEPEEEIDFFEDPQKAVSKAIESHPDVVKARESSAQMQAQTAMSALKEKHPDMQAVLQNPNFAEWVQGSAIRKELYQRADQGYDFNAADELISLYKERSQAVQQTVQTETAARQQAVKQASTGSSSGANTSGSKRVYRRADIIKLMKTDPDRYEALSPELMQAYAEGRVR